MRQFGKTDEGNFEAYGGPQTPASSDYPETARQLPMSLVMSLFITKIKSR